MLHKIPQNIKLLLKLKPNKKNMDKEIENLAPTNEKALKNHKK